jgi:ABC-type amino acid transport substrate-binding protein
VTRAALGTTWIAVFLLMGAGAGAADLEDIRNRGEFRVLAADDETPLWFSFRDDGEPGFEREVLAGFARVQKLKLVLVPVVRWDDAIPDLVKGRGDVLAGINATEARRKLIDFSDELLPAKHVVVTRAPHALVRTTEQLRSERVAVAAGTTWWDAVAAAGVPPSRIVKVDDAAQSFAALREGKATATVLDVLDFFFERRKDRTLEMGMTLGDTLSSSWAVRKTDPMLRQALNQYLRDLRNSAAWSRIVVKYFGEDALAVLGRAGANTLRPN